MGNSIKEKQQQVEIIKKKIDIEFDFREMIQFKSKPIDSDYKLIQIISRGKKSTIYRALLKKGGFERAVKVIKKKSENQNISQHIVNEVFILKNLDHPNVSKCFDVYENPKSYYLVSQYLSGGKLFDRIIEKTYFSQTDICIYFYDILQIIRYLHSKKIMHRDIRPQNLIFCDRQNNTCIKIIDFSNAIEFEQNVLMQRPRIGQAHYMAPQVINRKYNEKCDLWSAGVILYIMLSGEPPFNGRDENDIISKITNQCCKFDKPKWINISDNAKDLVMKLLNPDPSLRISAATAMAHPWFQRGKSRTGKQSYLRDTLGNMKKFYSLKKMQEGILVFMVNFLSSNSERDALMKAFKMVDSDGDGKISLKQLQASYQKVQGLSADKAQRLAKKIFYQVDKNKSGFIDYSEFLISSMNINSSLTDKKLESAFVMLDQDGDGAIDLDELKNVLGPNIPTEVYGLIVQEFDDNKNGLISKEEFVAMMKAITFKL